MACRVFKLNQIRQFTGFLVFFAFLCVAGMYYRTFYTNELLITTQQLSDIEGQQSHVLNMPLLEKLHKDLDNIMSEDGVNMTRLNAYVKQIKELKLQNVLVGQTENGTDSTKEYSEEVGSEEEEALNDYAEDDEEGELEARMEAQENSKANKTVNKRLVLEYDNPLLTTCEVVTSPPRFMRKPTVADPQLGYEECRRICKELDEEWAMLQRGGCYCYHLTYPNPIIDLEQCDATCEAGDTTCVLKNKPHSITMRTGTWDGYREWTVWMGNKELDVRVRYKDCLRHKEKETECRPTIQRQSISDQSQPVTKKEAQMLLGCFTALTVLKSPSIKAEKVFKNRPQSHMYCRDFCGNNGAPYAFLESAISKKSSTRRCFCTDTLKLSQPTDACLVSTLGYLVYWSGPDDKTPTLKFSPPVKKVGKVLVIARYRSGSSMTQSFFAKMPNSMAYFEPGKLKGRTQIKPGDRATLRALEAFYSCNPSRIELMFHNAPFLLWSSKMLGIRAQDHNFADSVHMCSSSRPYVNCLPYWLEACQRAEFLNVKTIRVLTAEPIREFIERNPDVDTIHLVRDPRGLLAAQKTFGKRSPFEYICNELLDIGAVIRDSKSRGLNNAHEVYYEQLAINSSYYGAKIYRELGLDMPPEVAHFLSREDYKAQSDITKKDSQVVKTDPQSSVYKFLKTWPLDEILHIDEECADVYKFWPTLYTNFKTLYIKHKKEVLEYISDRNRPRLERYIKTHKLEGA